MTRHCLSNGFLTGADGILSAAPFDFAFASMSVVVACNRLRCQSCRQSVHAIDGYTFIPELRLRLREVRAQTDAWLIGEGLLQPLAHSRTYFCECEAFSTTRLVPLDAEEEPLAPQPPWRCDGHPELVLPAMLDGEHISEATDFTALLARAWAAHPAQPFARWKGDWPGRLYALLSPGPLAGRVADAALAALESQEPSVAVHAAIFFACHAAIEQAGRLPETYERNPEHFLRTMNPGEAGQDLRFWLLQAVGRRLFEVGRADAATLVFARRMAMGPGTTPLQLVGALQKLDAEMGTRG
jgi:hypothetical protein